MGLQPANHVLLTGAGFTKPYGGFLASEMWATILNIGWATFSTDLLCEIHGCLNFEDLYQKIVLDRPPGDSDRDAFLKAARAAYARMHASIIDVTNVRNVDPTSQVCRRFIPHFRGTDNKRGYFFTLNQDLFVEHYYDNSFGELVVPGMGNQKWFSEKLPPRLTKKDRTAVPDKGSVSKRAEEFRRATAQSFAYVKLHGSYGWYTKDDPQLMIIGRSKPEQINRFPLLKWYSSLFKPVLHRENMRLVVVGYGFQDEHINEVIATGVDQFGLKLFIVCPDQAAQFRGRMVGVHGTNSSPIPRGEDIWRGIVGYYSGCLTDFFMGSTGDPTRVGKQFFEDVGLE